MTRDQDPGTRAAASSRPRRRRRRTEAVTYRVRVDLQDTNPPLWRRLELASDLFLDQVHDVVQVAFGWTDSHLHGFGSGPAFYSAETERYLCPYDVAEGEAGIPEREVRLDEVLADPGDKLFYAYDYGDDWQHEIVLEAVLPRTGTSRRAICTGGQRRGPAEDCGGAHCYELIEAATDHANPGRARAILDLAEMFGAEIDAVTMTGTAFDLDQISAELLARDTADQVAIRDPSGLPGPVADLVGAVRTASERQLLLRLIGAASLDQPVLIEAASAARMVRPYSWLLDRVGDEGIKLTGAGYLPPAHVAAATAELGLGREWIGKGNRETQTLPVLVLRETAQRMGLLRKYSGKLLLTPAGRAARADPVALWWRLAEQMPPRSKDACEEQAGLLLLLLVAAETSDNPGVIIARLLTAIGWMFADGMPISPGAAATSAWDTKAVLRRIGAFEEDRRSYEHTDEPTKDGLTFARAALRTWPSGGGRAGFR